MQAQLLSSASPFDGISPYTEMGAYEALWAKEKTSFKMIADLVRDSRSSSLSSFVDERESSEFAGRVFERLRSRGLTDFGVHVRPDFGYPNSLLDAEHPVELLYYRGYWDLIHTPSVAVVGARNPTDDGLKRARNISRLLVDEGYTVVSGLAAGIDAAAHFAAIARGGNTIAVIGTSIDHAYPRQNSELQEQIAKDHLLISQVPVWRYGQQGPAGNRLFFPERNITMSAITQATVIVEASDTSGTLIQARAAIKQGRKLFILESCFQNQAVSWPRRFENQSGVFRVKNFDEIKDVIGRAEQAVED